MSTMAEIDRLLAQAFELHHAEFAEEDDEDPDIVHFVHYVLGWADRTNRLGSVGVPAGVKMLIAFHREALLRLQAAFPEVFEAQERLIRLGERLERMVSDGSL